mmetsp:Transcript_27509/g.47661  ORF Transcript_27509/g.47661 Transcript_27509/m.47661 type:complete len:92 (+) Transcript_27509:179-454(+)
MIDHTNIEQPIKQHSHHHPQRWDWDGTMTQPPPPTINGTSIPNRHQRQANNNNLPIIIHEHPIIITFTRQEDDPTQILCIKNNATMKHLDG